MLSRAIWALYLSILIIKKIDLKNIVDLILGGHVPGVPPPPLPLDPPLVMNRVGNSNMQPAPRIGWPSI